MCPNKELLSVYFDNEMPSPWREKLGAHLAICPECRAVADGYAKAASLFHESAEDLSRENEAIDAAADKVWQKLMPPEHLFAGFSGAAPEKLRYAKPLFWKRRVSVPFPALAAVSAAAVVIVFSSFLMRQPNLSSNKGAFAAKSDEAAVPAAGTAAVPAAISSIDFADGIPEIPAAANLGDVLQYLNSGGDGDFVILRLPESHRFNAYDEPRFITTADYVPRGQLKK
jgi:hypothetical protein